MKKFTVISDDDYFDELFISKFLERNKNEYILNNILISSDKIEQFKKIDHDNIFYWKDLQRHYKKSFDFIEEIDALDYKKFYSAEQDFFKVLDFINPDGNDFSIQEARYEYKDTLHFCTNLIKNFNSDFYIFTNIPHSNYTLVLFKVLKKLEIPFIILRETLPSLYIFENSLNDRFENMDFQDESNFSNPIINFQKDEKNIVKNKKLYSKLRNHDLLENKIFNIKFLNIGLINFFLKSLSYFIFQIIKNVIKTLIFYIIKNFNLNINIKFQNPLDLADQLKKKNKTLINSKNSEFFISLILFKHDIKKFFYLKKYKEFSINKLPEKFIYFPLHFQPEATTYPYGGFFTDQINAIEMLSKSIPKDVKIIIKEHKDIFNTSRKAWYRGMFSRNIKFLDRIKCNPNVQFISIDFDNDQLVKKSLFVATITGTLALESALLGKRSLVFGDAWFKNCEGVEQISSKSQLNQFIETKKFHQEINKSLVQRFFNILNQNSFILSKSGIDQTNELSKMITLFEKNLNNLLK